MNDPLLWFIILAAGFCTYLLRLSFIQLWERLSLPRWLHRALQYVPAAVLAALVLPALLRSGSGIDISPDNLRLLAGGSRPSWRGTRAACADPRGGHGRALAAAGAAVRRAARLRR